MGRSISGRLAVNSAFDEMHTAVGDLAEGKHGAAALNSTSIWVAKVEILDGKLTFRLFEFRYVGRPGMLLSESPKAMIRKGKSQLSRIPKSHNAKPQKPKREKPKAEKRKAKSQNAKSQKPECEKPKATTRKAEMRKVKSQNAKSQNSKCEKPKDTELHITAIEGTDI